MIKENTEKLKETKGSQSRRRFEGLVLNKSGVQTIRVSVDTLKMHPKYRKQYLRTKKYGVHDETGLAAPGDMVVFEECRPISKTKKWRVVSVSGKHTK